MLVYDITKANTFENLEKWLLEVRENADEKIQIIMVGNKNDLEGSRQVTKEMA